MLVGKDFQRFDHFTESLVRIFINNDLVKIFLVNPLYTSTLFQGIFEIFFLQKMFSNISKINHLNYSMLHARQIVDKNKPRIRMLGIREFVLFSNWNEWNWNDQTGQTNKKG